MPMRIARSEWAKTTPRFDPLGPVSISVIHHTASPAPRRSWVQSDENWRHALITYTRNIEEQATRRKDRLIAIAYHRLYFPDGTTVEGRPIDKMGAATYGYNQKSRAYCFVGDFSRGDQPTGAATEALIADLRADTSAGWLTGGPHPTHGHRDLVATACPGDGAYRLLGAIRARVAQNAAPAAPTLGAVRPMYQPPLHLEPIVADLACPTGGVWLLAASGAVYAFGGAPFRGSPNGQGYFAGRTAARLELAPAGATYTVVATSGETYNY